jgi:hypothetical protein
MANRVSVQAGGRSKAGLKTEQYWPEYDTFSAYEYHQKKHPRFRSRNYLIPFLAFFASVATGEGEPRECSPPCACTG